MVWVGISSSGVSSRPRGQTPVSCISCTGRWVLYHCTTEEAQEWFGGEAEKVKRGSVNQGRVWILFSVQLLGRF